MRRGLGGRADGTLKLLDFCMRLGLLRLGHEVALDDPNEIGILLFIQREQEGFQLRLCGFEAHGMGLIFQVEMLDLGDSAIAVGDKRLPFSDQVQHLGGLTGLGGVVRFGEVKPCGEFLCFEIADPLIVDEERVGTALQTGEAEDLPVELVLEWHPLKRGAGFGGNRVRKRLFQAFKCECLCAGRQVADGGVYALGDLAGSGIDLDF